MSAEKLPANIQKPKHSRSMARETHSPAGKSKRSAKPQDRQAAHASKLISTLRIMIARWLRFYTSLTVRATSIVVEYLYYKEAII